MLSGIRLNQTITPLALVEYELILTNLVGYLFNK